MHITQCAPAKINLALHVRDRLDNGYHILDTIFAFAADGDTLTAEPAQDLSLNIAGPFATGLAADDDNLILKAAKILAKTANIAPNITFRLEKNLPIASGIGGGSADAAAALRLCNILWGLDWPMERLAEIGLELGADVPACLRSISAHGGGIGEKLAPLARPAWEGLPILLVNPLKAVSTAKIFAAWDGQDKGPLTGELNNMDSVLAGRNDLQPMAMALCPDIVAILEHMQSTQPMLTRMSGSGATCFALYPDMQSCQVAEQELKAIFPDYWVKSSRLFEWAFYNGG